MMLIGNRLMGQQDPQGNMLFMRVFYDEYRKDRYCTLHLRLNGERKPRNLGYVDFDTHIFYCQRDSKKHYHYKSEGYGFNEAILRDDYLNVERVCAIIDDAKYLFPKSVLFNMGSVLQFVKSGFELQRFLKFEIIKKFIHNEQVNLYESISE
jgi:hypothetical protein